MEAKKAQNKDEWRKTEVQKEIPIYIPMTRVVVVHMY